MALNVKEGQRDHWLFPVEIGSGQTNIKVTETVSETENTWNVDISTGTYFCFHRMGPNRVSDPQANATPTWKTGFDGLYREICNKLNSNTTGSTSGGGYQIEWVPPADSAFPHVGGIRLYHEDTNLTQFEIHVQSGGAVNPLPLEYLGFNGTEERRNGVSTITSSGDGTGRQELVGKYMAGGTFMSPHFASFKRSYQRREIEQTIVDFDRIVTTEWRDLRYRPMEYRRVPGAMVMKHRHEKPAYGDQAELDWWDNNNTFEACWEAIKDSEKFLIFHGVPWAGDTDPSGRDQLWPTHNCDIVLADNVVTDATTGETAFSVLSAGDVYHNVVEIARLVGQEQKARVDDAAVDEEQSSEYYRIDAPLIIDVDQRLAY